MSDPTQEQPAVTPTVSTDPARSRWHVSRIPAHLGRARTSTVVLAVLFLAIGTLYLNIRPATTGTATAGTTGNRAPASTSAPAREPTATTTPAPETTTEQPTTTGQSTTTGGSTDTTTPGGTPGGTPEGTLPTPTVATTTPPPVPTTTVNPPGG